MKMCKRDKLDVNARDGNISLLLEIILLFAGKRSLGQANVSGRRGWRTAQSYLGTLNMYFQFSDSL